MIKDENREEMSCTVDTEGMDEAIKKGYKKIKFISNEGITCDVSIGETIMQPLWHRIISECREKIEEKFKEYGNSWTEKAHVSVEDKFWKPRLEKEVQEVFQKFGTDRMPELIDVINICAMMYSLEAEIWTNWTRSGR